MEYIFCAPMVWRRIDVQCFCLPQVVYFIRDAGDMSEIRNAFTLIGSEALSLPRISSATSFCALDNVIVHV
nr:hypothetical protein CFP56_62477 [Quercus suber]